VEKRKEIVCEVFDNTPDKKEKVEKITSKIHDFQRNSRIVEEYLREENKILKVDK
jgi:hypothetical protein